MVRVSRRGVAIAALALPLAVAATVGTGTATASPADAGRVYISDATLTSTSQEVTINVKLGLLEHGKLGLTPPGGTKPAKVASGTGPQTRAVILTAACPAHTAP